MNTIGRDTLQLIREALQVVSSDFVGMVIGNQGANFSAGANLVADPARSSATDWKEIESMIRLFQTANMEIKYSLIRWLSLLRAHSGPAVAKSPLHGAAVQASAETYMGLVELGVG